MSRKTVPSHIYFVNRRANGPQRPIVLSQLAFQVVTWWVWVIFGCLAATLRLQCMDDKLSHGTTILSRVLASLNNTSIIMYSYSCCDCHCFLLSITVRVHGVTVTIIISSSMIAAMLKPLDSSTEVATSAYHLLP